MARAIPQDNVFVVRSRLDGHEARVLNAIHRAHLRSSARPNPKPDPGSDRGNPPGPSPEPPAPSRKTQREAELRAVRLRTNPDVAAALETSRINVEQADHLTKTDLPREVKARLLAEAFDQTADQTRSAVRQAEREQDQEHPENKLQRQRTRRRGSCGIDNDDMIWFSATLDPVTGAALKTEYDRRERAAYHHDIRTNSDPTAGVYERTAACLNLICDTDQLERPDGTAHTPDGIEIPASIARNLLCTAQINAWYQSADRKHLDLAWNVEVATPTQKLALAIRDATCRWKHCNTEATRCEAHHLQHRQHGGPTNLNNLARKQPNNRAA